MKAKKKVIGFYGVILLVLTLALSPKLSLGAEKYVTWYISGALTGPAASGLTPYIQGNTDYIAELNAEGGVDGVKIKTIVVDDRYDIARGISGYQRYRGEHKIVLVSTYPTGTVKALLPIFNRDKRAVLVPGTGRFHAYPGRIFLGAPPEQDGFGAALEWIVKDWEKKKNPGKPKVGFMGWDSAAPREALNGSTEYAKNLEIKLLPPELFPPGSLKHDVWLTRLSKQGANYIYICGVDPSTSNVIRDAAALGMTQNIQMMSSYYGAMGSIGVKLHPNELEGTVVVSPIIRGGEAIKHSFAKLYTKYRKNSLSEMPPFYLMGISMAKILEAGLKLALQDVGYEKVDGDAMYQALQKLTGIDVTQGLMGRLDYSPTSRRASREVRFYRVTGGELIPLSGWVTAPDTVSLATF